MKIQDSQSAMLGGQHRQQDEFKHLTSGPELDLSPGAYYKARESAYEYLKEDLTQIEDFSHEMMEHLKLGMGTFNPNAAHQTSGYLSWQHGPRVMGCVDRKRRFSWSGAAANRDSQQKDNAIQTLLEDMQREEVKTAAMRDQCHSAVVSAYSKEEAYQKQIADLKRQNTILFNLSRRYESITKEIKESLSLACRDDRKSLAAKVTQLDSRLSALTHGEEDKSDETFHRQNVPRQPAKYGDHETPGYHLRAPEIHRGARAAAYQHSRRAKVLLLLFPLKLTFTTSPELARLRPPSLPSQVPGSICGCPAVLLYVVGLVESTEGTGLLRLSLSPIRRQRMRSTDVRTGGLKTSFLSPQNEVEALLYDRSKRGGEGGLRTWRGLTAGAAGRFDEGLKMIEKAKVVPWQFSSPSSQPP
ncbi:hypothetical protein GUITHDRAFT_134407 [Guillardia theta CCMP2712]|uniref:Uncharacterized protein n=1 Tax=Guillardia theta (strain CCMP2712) TaxID=905079 RepID=L1JSR2_GUITC|nr:hypothetical protein GUITHDRAFT_134407 [Guillardia theta CCMP2712]EKX51482.1 hypothetical protein GUITHDRAFT_134407 [Guillardia theta CCMP2712]|eukprot:XP_005838462.1 hypothetical protein GUITHDRAFT_134407 [Guillardia theta CCMP2712]